MGQPETDMLERARILAKMARLDLSPERLRVLANSLAGYLERTERLRVSDPDINEIQPSAARPGEAVP